MKTYFCVICRLVIALGFFANAALRAADIEPPKAQVVDKFGVNMANGQVTHSLNTVSIGGAMGLSHSVSVIANEFNYLGYKGFRDKFLGEARNVNISTTIDLSPYNILRVYDFLGSADFGYYVNGVLQNSGSGLSSGYTYVSMGDERQILEYDNTYLYWTKPDGTVSRFYRGTCAVNQLQVPCADSYALLVDVTYPNGFVITVGSGGMSVTTNTGFQLKSLYPADNRPLTDKNDRRNCNGPNDPGPCLYNAPPADSAGWAALNPKYIKAINNAYEYCTPIATDCTLTRAWPQATFNWPAGMPRTMYIGTTGVTVVNAAGNTTTYWFKAYDVAYNGSTVMDGFTPNIDFSPRLVGIAPYGTSQVFTYDYKNVWANAICPWVWGCWDYRLQHAGAVTQATKLGLTTGYDLLEPGETPSPNSLNYAYGLNGVSRVEVRGKINGATGALYYADTDDGRIWFESSPRNFVYEFDNVNGPVANYTYARGNLTTISYNNGDTTVVATYPADCVSTPRNVCNQATSIKDARGNYTYYVYHTQSGQPLVITYPATKNSPTTTVTPQTRYEYTQLSAHYYAGGGSKIAGPPIWMKTAERYCINSNPSNGINGGSCVNNDEVITRYEYNNDNLLMTGMTVTDPTGKTLRTCFQYDIYGNQIGKTQPNANLSVCN